MVELSLFFSTPRGDTDEFESFSAKGLRKTWGFRGKKIINDSYLPVKWMFELLLWKYVYLWCYFHSFNSKLLSMDQKYINDVLSPHSFLISREISRNMNVCRERQTILQGTMDWEVLLRLRILCSGAKMFYKNIYGRCRKVRGRFTKKQCVQIGWNPNIIIEILMTSTH